MHFSEYVDCDATRLAELIRTGEVSPDELLSTALARTAAVNPDVNSVVDLFEQQARDAIASGLPNGPLRGVPFLVKDLGIDIAGTRTRLGARLFADVSPAKSDSALGAAYRHAGLVMFGKTNTPEFGISAATEPVMHGRTNNPWNLDITAGGSSGGAAAAVAAGIVPVAHGNDGGGSLRLPAAACGLFALKPTRGRISMAPAGEGWGGMSSQHVISRSVRDSALMLDLTCKPQLGDPYWVTPPADPFLEQLERPPSRLRIAYSTGAFLGKGLDPEITNAVQAAARLCEGLGHSVEETFPMADFDELGSAISTVVCASTAATLDTLSQQRGRPIVESDVEPDTWALCQIGKRLGAPEYVRSLQSIHRFTRTFSQFFGRYDVLITATTGQVPRPHGWLKGESGTVFLDRVRDWAPNTSVFNATGQPAMTLPLYESRERLPIGVQFAARAGEEALLLKLAAQLELACPWDERVRSLASLPEFKRNRSEQT